MFNCRDRQLHARKRRILAPAFTEASLKSMEERIVMHIDRFFQAASSEPLYRDAGKCWTANVATWSNWLFFDTMGDLVFGQDLGMIQGKESRDLPSVLDAASHRQLLVGFSIAVTEILLTRAVWLQCFHAQVAP
jgi:cytochrome P450